MTHTNDPVISERQHQIIKGTILGGSSIIKPFGGKNCYLSMRSKQGKWLEFKGGELRNLASHQPYTIEKTFRWHSLCFPIFTEYKKMFYKDKKRNLNEEILDLCRLSDIAFMVWYGDAGVYYKEHVILNTHVWGKKGNEILVDYFATLGYKTEIIKERQSFRIKLDKQASASLIRLIVPHSMGFFSR